MGRVWTRRLRYGGRALRGRSPRRRRGSPARCGLLSILNSEIHHQSTLAVYVCAVHTLVVYVDVVTGSEFPIAPSTRSTRRGEVRDVRRDGRVGRGWRVLSGDS